METAAQLVETTMLLADGSLLRIRGGQQWKCRRRRRGSPRHPRTTRTVWTVEEVAVAASASGSPRVMVWLRAGLFSARAMTARQLVETMEPLPDS